MSDQSPDPEIARLSRECGELREKVAEYEPYFIALHSRHNGYDAVFRQVTDTREPKSPKHALDNLIGEAEQLGIIEGRMESEARIAELERERDAAVAEAERLERELSERKHLIHSLIDENSKLKAQVDKATIQGERLEALLRRCLPYVNHYTSELAADLKAELNGDAT